MRNRPKYRVRIYDEAHLIDRGGFRVSWFRIIAVVLFLIIIGIAIGICIVWFSDVKRSLPGYLETEQRTRTEEAYRKADSLQLLYEVHQDYLNNVLRLLDSDREPETPDTANNAWRLEPDSMPSATQIEIEFIKRMEKAGYKVTLPAMPQEENEP